MVSVGSETDGAAAQAAKSLKAADEAQQRLRGAQEAAAQVAKELKADKATLKAKAVQEDRLTAELATSRKQLQVCLPSPPAGGGARSAWRSQSTLVLRSRTQRCV